MIIDSLKIQKKESSQVLWLILFSRLLNTWGDYVVYFYLPIIFAKCFDNTISTTSLLILLLIISKIIISPYIVQFIEEIHRLQVLYVSTIVRIISFLILAILVVNITLITENKFKYEVYSKILLYLNIIIPTIFMSLSSLTSEISVEKEWIRTIYPITNGDSKINKRLSQNKLVAICLAPITIILCLLIPRNNVTITITIFVAVIVLMIVEFVILRLLLFTRDELKEKTTTLFDSKDLYVENFLKCLFRVGEKISKHQLFLLIVSSFFLNYWYLSNIQMIFLTYLVLNKTNVFAIYTFVFFTALANLFQFIIFPLMLKKFSIIKIMTSYIIILSIMAFTTIPVYHFGGLMGLFLELIFMNCLLYGFHLATSMIFQNVDISTSHFKDCVINLAIITITTLSFVIFSPSVYFIIVWTSAFSIIIGSIIYFVWIRNSDNTFYAKSNISSLMNNNEHESSSDSESDDEL
eukprot:TRINITY_DN1301_c3_g1_i1.p1 TRINITY_DN1301_c3_g1~~TRINITY_DN1301_c3_g1_i1.p1  ORF type:complete len:544 (+),score=47.19 TRINITY_DN1301_c3_g1_i1:239-1633(+)